MALDFLFSSRLHALYIISHFIPLSSVVSALNYQDIEGVFRVRWSVLRVFCGKEAKMKGVFEESGDEEEDVRENASAGI